MIAYNTQLKHLALPEYGRNIQNMIDHCMTIEDRDERNHCARTIISAMHTLMKKTNTREPEDFRRKLWDHLAIMSGFQLDIDYPYDDMASTDERSTPPEKVPYSASQLNYRHYGKSLQRMIAKASAMEESPERQELVMLLAHQMKKQLLTLNREGVDDARVFKDLAMLSHGAIRLSTDTCRLHEFKVVAPPPVSKKRKKK